MTCARGPALVISAIALALTPADAQQNAFRAGVDVVQLNVAVTSGRRVVADLTAPDFEVTDNGVKQEILSISRDLLPIDVTMVIDTSESLTETMVRAIVSGVNRIRDRLRPEDRVSLTTFNHRIQERIALVPPPAARAIDLGRPTGQTSLFDAVAVTLAQKPSIDRRQMAIVFTDGFDSTSILTEADVLDVAARSTTTLFTVSKAPVTAMGSLTPESLTGPRQANFFDRVTAVTGGIAHFTSPYVVEQSSTAIRMTPNANILDEAFIKALEDFRSSYTIRYNLGGTPRLGWHTVAVKVVKRGTYQVRTRKGYIGG